MPIKIKLAIPLLLLSAIALVLGAVALPWWSGALPSGRYTVDLRKMLICIDGVCGAPKALSALGAPWAKMGVATMVSSLAAALSLLLVAATVAMLPSGGKSLKVALWTSAMLTLFAGILGLAFALTHPSGGPWTQEWGMACTLAGSLVGATAVSVTLRAWSTPESS